MSEQFNSENPNNNLGTQSLILGIGSIGFAFVPNAIVGLIGLACGILGIVYSAKSKKQGGGGTSTAGLVLSIIGVSIFIIGFVIGFIIGFMGAVS